MRILLAIALIASTGLPALAYRLPPTTDKVTQDECGACHMVYPAGLLPARSWDAITSDLAHHFGEDASLAPDVTAGIKGYLMAHAGDSGPKIFKFARGVPADQTPLKVTDLPLWHRIHGDFSVRVMKKIGAVGNCSFCHKGAANGEFYED